MRIFFEDIDIQINTDEDDSNSLLENIQELYKWNHIYTTAILANKNKIGYERRLKAVENGISSLSHTIADQLKPIFENWLELHALTNPEEFGRKRGQDFIDNWDIVYDDFFSAFQNQVSTIISTIYPNTNKRRDRREEFTEFNNYVSKYPEILNLMSDYLEGTLEEIIQNYRDDYGENWDEEEYFVKIQEQNNYIEIFNIMREYGEEAFWENYFNYYGINNNLIYAIFEYIYFPAWYSIWSPRGIDETRERIENAYKILENIDTYTIGDKISYLNSVIGTAHQTGDMLDYIQEKYEISKDDLTKLSNLSNEELKIWEDIAREERLMEKVKFPSKNEWIEETIDTFNFEDTEELWDEFSKSYSYVGNPFQNKEELLKDIENNKIFLCDVDEDPLLDNFIVYKNTEYGRKIIYLGTDGNNISKKSLLTKLIDLLESEGYYAELSEKVAEIVSKYIQPINSESLVRSVLSGKEIIWYGDGTYQRNITGVGNKVKSLFGKPNAVETLTEAIEDVKEDIKLHQVSYSDLSDEEISEIIELVESGGEVIYFDKNSISNCEKMIIAEDDGKIIGFLAIKNTPKERILKTFKKANAEKEFNPDYKEIGYASINSKYRNKGLYSRMLDVLLISYDGKLYGTTRKDYIMNSLLKRGFKKIGNEFPSLVNKGSNLVLLSN